MRVLFLTRKFPPSVGGMQTLAEGLWRGLSRAQGTRALLVAHGGSNLAALPWLPRALWRTARAVRRGEVDTVLCGDVVMYLLARPLLRRTDHVVFAHGKDITYPLAGYRHLVRRYLPTAPFVLANSAATAEQALAVGVPPERVQVLRLGVPPPVPAVDVALREAARGRLQDHGLPDGAVVLVTVGRLVRRKGVLWFVDQVMPRLPGHYVLLVAGDGADAGPIAAAAAEYGLDTRVLLLGRVDDATRETLMRGADLFVQPNVRVDGDMEGFGLVAVEAAMRGAVVVAADLEGLADAVLDGRTGVLVPTGDAAAWAATITELGSDPEATRALGLEYAARSTEEYSTEAMASRLMTELATRRSEVP